MTAIATDIGPVLDGRPLPPKEREAFYQAEAQARYNREMGIVPDDTEQEDRAREQEKDAMRQMGAST